MSEHYEIREEIRTNAERMEQTARRLDRIEVRTQARLDQFSAEHGISPPIDLDTEVLPPHVDPNELADFIGQETVLEGQSAQAELEHIQEHIRYLACQVAPKPGSETCYPIMFATDPNHPQFLSHEEIQGLRDKFDAFGVPTKIIPPTEPHFLFKLEASVEEELVDQYISGWVAMMHLVDLGKIAPDDDEGEEEYDFLDPDNIIEDE